MKKEQIATFMSVFMVSIYIVLYFWVGLESTLTMMALIGTCGALIVGIIKFSMRPKKDKFGKFHNSRGQFISSKSGYYGCTVAFCTLILPVITKPDMITSTFSVFIDLPIEVQVSYVGVVHALGFIGSR